MWCTREIFHLTKDGSTYAWTVSHKHLDMCYRRLWEGRGCWCAPGFGLRFSVCYIITCLSKLKLSGLCISGDTTQRPCSLWLHIVCLTVILCSYCTSPLSSAVQGAADLHHQGPRLPNRPNHQEELGPCQQAGRHRLLFLRQHTQQLPHHQRGWIQGMCVCVCVHTMCLCVSMMGNI